MSDENEVKTPFGLRTPYVFVPETGDEDRDKGYEQIANAILGAFDVEKPSDYIVKYSRRFILRPVYRMNDVVIIDVAGDNPLLNTYGSKPTEGAKMWIEVDENGEKKYVFEELESTDGGTKGTRVYYPVGEPKRISASVCESAGAIGVGNHSFMGKMVILGSNDGNPDVLNALVNNFKNSVAGMVRKKLPCPEIPEIQPVERPEGVAIAEEVPRRRGL